MLERCAAHKHINNITKQRQLPPSEQQQPRGFGEGHSDKDKYLGYVGN